HLRSSIGLRGYAQVDPKVEYKREGMKLFEEMWNGVSDKVTDLVFRMEQLDPDFLSYLGARWQLDRAQTIHESASAEPEALPPGPPRAPAPAQDAPRARPRRARGPPRRQHPRPPGGGDRRHAEVGQEARAAPQRR